MIVIWKDRCLECETVRDAAERFIREMFGVERRIVWGQSPGEFRFGDGYWCYRISFGGGHWLVVRLNTLTPKARSYAKARSKLRRRE